MTQSAGGDGAEECFFERAPDRAVAGTIDNAEFYHLVLQQPQGPACASLGRLGTDWPPSRRQKSEQRQASRAACGSTRPRSPLPPVVCAPGKPSMGWFPELR